MAKKSGFMRAAALLAVAAGLWGGPAMAQDSDTEAGNSPRGGDQQEAASSNVIIVSAQKREQAAQDVPLAISAVQGAALQEQGITDVQSLQVAVPNITIGTSFGYANLFIRGLGLNSVFANVDPSVTLHEDGAVISQPAAQLFSFFDLERVEVLRGPQGTLYGRNATGGTINLITAKPTDYLSGYARIQGGNYGALESEGAVSGPLSDTVAARLSYFVSTRDGFGTNLVSGNDVNDYDSRAFRGQIRFEPTQDFEFLLSASYGRENDSANALQFKRETFPGVLTDDNPANDSLVSPGRGGFPTAKPRDYASDVDPVNLRKTWSVTGHATYDISDVFSLTNTLNYRKFTMDMAQDLDLSSVRTSSIQDFVFDDHQWSEELQLNVNTGKLDLVTGFYYFAETLNHENSVGVAAKAGEFPASAIGDGRRVHLTGTGKNDTWALFWNANYELTDWLTLRGGGRFTRDHRTVNNDSWIWQPPNPGCDASNAVDSTVLPDAPPPAAGQRYQCFYSGPDDERTFKDYTNEAGIQLHPSDDVMLYYTYSEGFKAGTGQLGTTQSTPPFIIDPETISNHEIGIKSTWFGGDLTFNLAAYKYTLDDVQLDRTLPGGPAGFITIWENATTQKGKGVELNASWSPTPLFRGNLSLALQDTRFGSFISTNPTNPLLYDPSNPALLEDIKGNPARNAPKFAGTLRLEHDIPLNDGSRFTLAGAVTHKSRVYFTEFKDPVLSQEGYTMLDASLRYKFADDRWSASIFVNNVTDELVEGANFVLGTGRVIARTFLPPRTYGASLSFHY